MRMPLAVLCVTCAAPAAAQELYPTWYVRGEFGASEIHGHPDRLEADLDSPWGGGRVGRAFGRSGILAVDGGVAGSSADGGFFTATGGLELRAFARSRASPFVRLEAGFLSDTVGDCFVAGWGTGLSVRVVDSVSLRAGFLFCSHCLDGHGPVVASLGLEYRW